jgi:enamine deaminase RidA (YjgF/YER057c/UK114 family)
MLELFFALGTRGEKMATIEALTRELGLVLPEPPVQDGNYVSAKTVGGIISVNGYVNAIPGFPEGINGASDLFVEIVGETGHHVRAATGVSSLSRNALVELQMSAEVRL